METRSILRMMADDVRRWTADDRIDRDAGADLIAYLRKAEVALEDDLDQAFQVGRYPAPRDAAGVQRDPGSALPGL